MIISDDDIQTAIETEKLTSWRRCNKGGCKICDPYPDLTKEDLVKDLIEARAQIKVLESNQCAC